MENENKIGCGKWIRTVKIQLEYEFEREVFCGQKQQYEEFIIDELCPECQSQQERSNTKEPKLENSPFSADTSKSKPITILKAESVDEEMIKEMTKSQKHWNLKEQVYWLELKDSKGFVKIEDVAEKIQNVQRRLKDIKNWTDNHSKFCEKINKIFKEEFGGLADE